MSGRAVWNVSSTTIGGGVAEMLRPLVGYGMGLGIDVRWCVIDGDAEFFAVTKRLHNRIHGQPGDGGELGPVEAERYEKALASNAAALAEQVRAGDVVLLHDPQTAGLTAAMVRRGAKVVWRCHIGADMPNEHTRQAWSFLRPYLSDAAGYVISRRGHVPAWLPQGRVWIIPPSIDPFSAKNQDIDPATVRAILTRTGIVDGSAPGSARFVRHDGSAGEVERSAAVIADQLPAEDDRVVTQVSRWDRLKDMAGVMRGFADHVAGSAAEYLILAGPAVGGVTDDPESREVHAQCVTDWRTLPAAARRRIALAELPLDDVDENQPDEADRMGAAARAHVTDNFVGDLHLLRYANLFSSLFDTPPR